MVGTSSFADPVKPMSNCPGLKESRQLDFIETTDDPDVQADNVCIPDGDIWILLRDINVGSIAAKGRCCYVTQTCNQTVVLQFDDKETRTLREVTIEKSIQWREIHQWQPDLRLLFSEPWRD
jgi:hypothetical protein